jgi:Diguanylate cyclase, GGDEF domain
MASAGLASWDRKETAAELFGRADAALYEAKQRGRDRTVATDRGPRALGPTGGAAAPTPAATSATD